ncbi:hypothetical protein [Thermococcus zilligii]|uniref:hypothetical protein n=1 Tax=Thermococcus zilligii TaxID=54076 RepID=UPI00029A4A31|nr:hypothetical protein [Thermococcus zilligii]
MEALSISFSRNGLLTAVKTLFKLSPSTLTPSLKTLSEKLFTSSTMFSGNSLTLKVISIPLLLPRDRVIVGTMTATQNLLTSPALLPQVV